MELALDEEETLRKVKRSGKVDKIIVKMSRRKNLIGLCAISGLFILLYAANHFSSQNVVDYENVGKTQLLGNYRLPADYYNKNNRLLEFSGDVGQAVDSVPTSQNMFTTIDDVVRFQRVTIMDEMENFEFTNLNGKLQDFTLETNGTPIRSVIITSWRSGSTFLGDILNAMPGNFYHYEPLLNYDIIQIRGPPHDKKAMSNIKKLLNCDYTDMEEYLEFGETHNYLFSHNTRLWGHCRLFQQFCYDPKFLGPFCKLFPLQSMKVVRIRMALAAQLLEDLSLNVRIVLLIRDPRGALQSRKHRVWCPGNPDCDHAPTVCNDMVSDYYAAVNLTKLYPNTFKALRYEDLSLNPYGMTKDVLKFYGLPFDPKVEEFLDSHTKLDIGGVSSTFRDSKSAPFHWTKDFSYSEVATIQESCVKAMKLWGYKNANSEAELLNNFNPLLPSPFL